MVAQGYWKIVLIIGVFFVVLQGLYLHRVPGLMGDEASEGQNVYELLTREQGITVMGERSYIGPLIDYVRVPFVGLFGYSALALRVVMLLASVATLAMAASIFRRWFGDNVALFPLVLMFFSLPYLTYQRLGWAITLFPLFFFLTIWIAEREWKYKWLYVGLVAGLGLQTHIMFLPTLLGMICGLFILFVFGFLWNLWFDIWYLPAQRILVRDEITKGLNRLFQTLVVLLIGFWAGFGSQFVVLQMFVDDQGDPSAVGGMLVDRLHALPELLPVVMSGSSFVARYTGVEFAPSLANLVTWLVFGLVILAVVLAWRNKYIWLWVIGLSVHFVTLMYMIDRFTLRYFLVFVLGVYVLAGVGIGEAVRLLAGLVKRWIGQKMAKRLVIVKALGLAIVMSGVWVGVVLVPFLRTGGSVSDFSLGNRTNSASALVDERSLLDCVRGRDAVGSENVHIYNRLLYLSHAYRDIDLVPDEEVSRAQYLVHYRDEEQMTKKVEAEVCPGLSFFVVEKKVD